MDTPFKVMETNPAASNGISDTTDAAPELGGPEVARAVESAKTPPTNPLEFTSSRGIKFKLRKVPKLAIVDAGKKIKDPPVPMFFNEDKERNEPNPNDPNYIDSLRDTNYRRGMAITNVSLVLGTEIVGPLPEGISGPNDSQWSDDLNELGLEIPTSGRMRYVAWCKYYALDDEEFTSLTRQVMSDAGMVFGEEVAEATVAFPSDEARNTDT